ncbi:MAG: sigma-70 family RNA polymerase sigma factor [Leptospiraceae bacterium]|nr:sigma-70 family RNA polymerase sigma factor [Leptospiraceae bacterium]
MTEAEFARIVASTKKAVLAAIRTWLSNELIDHIDDVAQESYIRLFRFIEAKGKAALREESMNAFLYTIAKNESLKYNRQYNQSQWMIKDLSQAQTVTQDGPDADHFLDQTDLKTAIAELDAGMQQLAGLHLRGYQHDEIAALLQIPVGTVKSRMHRLRKQLQSRLTVQEDPDHVNLTA